MFEPTWLNAGREEEMLTVPGDSSVSASTSPYRLSQAPYFTRVFDRPNLQSGLNGSVHVAFSLALDRNVLTKRSKQNG